MEKFGIGQSVRRVEDRKFVTGQGRYVDDIRLPRQCYGVMVHSSHAHALIVNIDTAGAENMPGVLLVLTGKDAVADKLGGFVPFVMPEDFGAAAGHASSWPVLAEGRVRFVGERVAFVVAETLGQARDAAEFVEVDYEPLSSASHVEDAVASDALALWNDCPGGNVAYAMTFGDEAATDAAFASARHVVSLKLENNRLAANAMEPRASIGYYEASTGDYELFTSAQNPHGVRSDMARILGIAETRLRVVAPDVGGGFGMKYIAYPEDAAVLWASRRLGRPVKWTGTRSESLLGDSGGRDQVVQGELALDENGKIIALRSEALQALGAYITGPGVAPSLFTIRFQPSVYDIQTVCLQIKGVFTNTSPIAPYRGAGRPEAIYLIERLLDEAAIVTGLSQVEIRLRNLIPPEALPYKTATNNEYDSGEFAFLMERCLALSEWDSFPARREVSERNGKRRGRSVCFFIEFGGIFNERMEIRFDPTGTATIVAGTFSHGQGHATTYSQMVSEWLGIPFDEIRFVQGDTDKVPFGRGTHASRSVTLGGSALKMAADEIIEKARKMAASLMAAEVDDTHFVEGQFRVSGTNKSMPMADVAKSFYKRLGPTTKYGLGLEASGFADGSKPNFPNGCHSCEVEVDIETGEVTLDRYVGVDDVGRAINPLICHGQVHGGIAQGVGQALMEHMVYDRESGQLISGSFMDYAMPRAENFPEFVSELVEIPARTNPLGVKGVGESGCLASPPAVMNAVIDALRPLGVNHLDMPATMNSVWGALQRARHYAAFPESAGPVDH
ncbi:MAG: carbon monoxide dehydrogenase [Bradyrhizobium sp.]|nr:carbon monoxide dehydrogenase [Bradyrhizobium sp.]